MANISISFFILAPIFLIFGANGIAGLTADDGKILLIFFIISSAISYFISLYDENYNEQNQKNLN